MSDWKTLCDILSVTIRPTDEWPGKLHHDWERESSPFTAPIKDTLRKLNLELRELRAKRIIFQAAFRERDLRLDGLPRADARASHPGIILTFDSKHGTMRFAFDKFRKWEHNLRAIAMHLEHLRHATLYGVGSDGEPYRGWRALPPGETATPPKPQTPPPSPQQPTTQQQYQVMDRNVAEVLARASTFYVPAILAEFETCQAAYRQAAQTFHPDKPGGDADRFKAITEAYCYLKVRFGK